MNRTAAGFAGWETAEQLSDSGQKISMKMPVILTASRATDIPAFFGEWFVERLGRGYVSWKNRFNQRTEYISFAKTRVIVFWTKNAAPFIPYISRLDSRGIGYYFQYTLNDYEDVKLEAGLPPLAERVETFRKLSRVIGKEKVIWRFDPLILLPGISVADLLRKIEKLGDSVVAGTDRFVFSFVDIAKYRKVRCNLVREGVFDAAESGEFTTDQKFEFARGLQDILGGWRNKNSAIKAVTCGEDIDLSRYGIGRGSCVDGALMTELFGHDRDLMRFFGKDSPGAAERSPKLKDRGQRKECGCVVSKDIGQYDTCGHGCLYCYANSCRELPQANLARHRSEPAGECIVR